MFKIFSQFPSTPSFHYSTLRDVDAYRIHRDKLSLHYQMSNNRVHNSHPILSLLNTLHTQDLEQDEFLRVGLARAVDMHKQIGFSSELSYGEPREGAFFNEDVTDAVIVDLSHPTLAQKQLPLEYIHPLEVMYHPYTALDLAIPNGKSDLPPMLPRTSVAVFKLNIGLMLVKAFRYGELQRTLADSIRLDEFVHSYIMADTFDSYTDICLMNQVFHHYKGIDPKHKKYVHPRRDIPGLRNMITHTHPKQQRRTRAVDIKAFIERMPHVSDGSARASVAKPENVWGNSQSSSCVLMAKLCVVEDLLVSINKNLLRTSKSDIINVQVVLNKYIRSRALDRYTSGNLSLRYELKHRITEVLSHLKSII